MRRFALLLILLTGCVERPAVPIAPAAVPTQSTKQPTKPDRQVVDLEQLTFHHGSHRSLLTSADAAARRIADASWQRQPYVTRQESYVIESHWTSGELAGAPSANFGRHGLHDIRLTAYRQPKQPNEVLGVRVSATWRPKESGWGAHVSYFDASELLSYPYQPDSFRLVFRWHSDGTFDYLASKFEIYPDVSHYQATKTIDGTEYSIGVWTSPRPGERTRVNAATAMRWLASAEAMRDEAMTNLNALADRARQEIPSGAAVRDARQTGPEKTPPGPVGLLPAASSVLSLRAMADGPRAIPPPKSHRKMTDEEKRLVLEEALAEIERRKQLLQENYQVWFAALDRAFPLRDCLRKANE